MNIEINRNEVATIDGYCTSRGFAQIAIRFNEGGGGVYIEADEALIDQFELAIKEAKCVLKQTKA
jgi:hypothetical protein